MYRGQKYGKNASVILLYFISFYFTFFRFILLFSKFHERPRLITQLYIISLIVFLNLMSLKMIKFRSKHVAVQLEK